MLRFKFKDGDKIVEATTPTDWAEVTLGQFIDIETKWDRKDLLQLFAILTGVDISVLSNTRTKKILQPIAEATLFIYEPLNWNRLKRPKSIYLHGKELKVPKNLGMELFGQKVMLLQKMQENEDDWRPIIPFGLALYFQPLYDGKFSRDRVEVFEEKILKIPALLAYPIAFFFYLDN